MTEPELLSFLKDINKNINLKFEDGLLNLYHNNKYMGIGIAGELTNGTDYTLGVLRTEVKEFIDHRLVVKETPKENKQSQPNKKKSFKHRDKF